jgi:hypothetical protein
VRHRGKGSVVIVVLCAACMRLAQQAAGQRNTNRSGKNTREQEAETETEKKTV